MLKTNKDRLVQIGLEGPIAHPISKSPYKIKTDGTVITLPGTGGITLNVAVGDPACGWVADHVEPGVSLRIKEEPENSAFNTLACIGNLAQVVSGEAKGATGWVTGKHGGIEHVLAWFDKETLLKLAIGDRISVRSWGTGLKIVDAPQVAVHNLDPELLERMELRIVDGVLEVPVTTSVPAHLMGSGIGDLTTHRGDYDIMTADPEAFARYNLEHLRLGDLVELQDCDNRFGRGYLKGAVSIGVVTHSDCVLTGHGPGVTTLFTCNKPLLRGVTSSEANIGKWLGIF
ncbi:MAG: DUF4438 domain-containing protein [Firmicutes bacterium]|nr:DUF4438 domain-containing protein [Bacillota bacterium]